MEMNPDKIQNLVLEFFRTIGSQISAEDGLYKIAIPEKYRIYFQTSDLQIAFDRKISSRHNCELVMVGSKILSLVIANCSRKGPIALKQSSSNGSGFAIRYHFFVNFSGISSKSWILHVDIDWNTLKPISIDGDLEDADFELDSRTTKCTSAYIAALDELKRQCSTIKSEFLNQAQSVFQDDFDLFVGKYDFQIRSLDSAINKKENTSEDDSKISKFRFDTIERIKSLEKERSTISSIMQEKHKITLGHNLIACEIIRTGKRF